jgi:thioredoxin 1
MKRNGELTMQKALFIQLAVGLLIGGSLGAVMGYFGKCATGACPLTANPWRGGFIGAAIGGLFAFSAGSSRPGERIAPVAPEAVDPAVGSDQATPLHIGSAEAFERVVLKANQPVLVDFYADWCGPCRMLAPTIEKLAQEYQGRVIVCKVDVDNLSSIAGQYGIEGIPAVFVFDKGKVVERLVGVRPQRDYAQALDRILGRS